MKVLTLTQPWATLVAIGAKKIETRSWSTKYRGPLLIHAAAGLKPVGGTEGLMELCRKSPFREILIDAGYLGTPELPRGAIIAVCKVCACVSTDAVEDDYFGGPRVLNGVMRLWKLTDQERAFGDYSPGRYAWLLADVRALPDPIPTRGAIGLWDYEGSA